MKLRGEALASLQTDTELTWCSYIKIGLETCGCSPLGSPHSKGVSPHLPGFH